MKKNIFLLPRAKQLRFTKKGHEALLKKYEELVTSRPDAVMHLKKSREMGDLSENGYYKSSRAKLSFIDSQIRHLAADIKAAVIVDETPSDQIDIGSTVTLKADQGTVTYEIVGDREADPGKRQISLLSPLGKSLAGKKSGDAVTVHTPSGESVYTIIEVS
jgi:transcription elongation factor GreA